MGRRASAVVAAAVLALAIGMTIVPAAPVRAASSSFLTDLFRSIQRTTTTTTAPATPSTIPALPKPAPTPELAVAEPPLDLEPGCGTKVFTKANGTRYVCSFSDNFDLGYLDRTKWVPQTSEASGFGSKDDCYLDHPNNIRVRDHILELRVVQLAEPITCRTNKDATYSTRYTSASISTWSKWSQAFGRFEFKARFPAASTKGLHGALWLWPDNALRYGPHPMSGEIDVAEVYSAFNDRAIPYVHYLPKRGSQTNNYCLLDVTRWHTYVLEWTRTHIQISFDGKLCVNEKISPMLPLVAPQPFDQPFMLALTQGLGVGGNRLDPAGPPSLPATMQVDYVRAWK